MDKAFFVDKMGARILMGGHITDRIILEQGVPQGDVVSSYIFIMMVELLLIKINFTNSIYGSMKVGPTRNDHLHCKKFQGPRSF